jgi:peptidoglycan-associated lipoprotein
MQTGFRSAVFLLAISAVAMLLTGCPKRPATAVVSAPAPAAPAPAPPAPAPAPVAPAPAPPPAPVAPAPAPPPAPPPVAAPAPPPPAAREYMPNSALKDIYFDFDKSNIRPRDAKILDASLAYLKANPGEIVLVEGHCDERGTNEYNLALGERRAKSAVNYLVSRGIEASRFSVVSYGKERPVCNQRTEACYARNRHDRFLSKPR